MSENLIQCRYCQTNVVMDEAKDGGWFVICSGCGLHSDVFPRKNQLLRFWNTKPEDDNQERIKEIMELLRSLDKRMDIILGMAQKTVIKEQLPPPEET